MKISIKSILIKSLRISILSYAGLILLLFIFQRRLIYLPTGITLERALIRAEMTGFDPWYVSGELLGFSSDPGDSDSAVLILHGNEGSALDRGYLVEILRQAGLGDWNIYIMEYPGFGARGGRSSENSFFSSGEVALLDLDEKYRKLIIVGESIGGGTASYLAGRFPEKVDGLILSTPFDSLAGAASARFPYLPVRIMLLDRFDNKAGLSGYSGPVSFIALEKDPFIPKELSAALYESYEGPGLFLSVPGKSYSFLYSSSNLGIWEEAVLFVEP